jgi:porphobilinogen synthase
MVFPEFRPRRMRQTETFRSLIRETRLVPEQMILPLFVLPGKGIRQEIPSMPGVFRLSVDQLVKEAKDCLAVGIRSVILFGLPEKKDGLGSGAYAKNGIIQQAIRELKNRIPEMTIITDVCLCEYTDHGHCGLLNTGHPRPNPRLPEAYVLNEPTLYVLGKVAVSHAQAGADMVAPSCMMDGRVAALRGALDAAEFEHVGVVPYAAKYASCFCGSVMEASEAAPKFGDRKSHQLDMANTREAVQAAALDVGEGADLIMIEPALPCLDIVQRVHAAHPLVPVVAYHASGEYAMLKAAAANGWLDERPAVLETLTAIRRAGADLIVTYHAKDAARWLAER